MRLVGFPSVQKIRTPQQYEAALARFEELFGSIPGSPEAAELDKLAVALDRYEDPRTYAIRALQLEAWLNVIVVVGGLVGGFILGDAIYKAVF